MKKNWTLFLAVIFILLISIGLRLGLTAVNRESNDNHSEVIDLILATDRFPELGECTECFQPKLFYFLAASFLKLTGLNHSSQDTQILSVEILNSVAGIITILVIGLFLYRIPLKHYWLKVFAFGLLALNPKLIGINSQSTNDTLAILFSTVALYFCYSYLNNSRIRFFLFMTVFVVLGISTKTNIWVTAIAILVAILIKAWMEKKSWTNIFLVGLIFGLSVWTLTILNPLSQYLSNFQKFGTPVVITVEKQPLPNFFEESTEGMLPGVRPGILSIQDGFFTFKFFELLRHPRLQNEKEPYSPHRTSLWTQLYGRAHSVHFDNWPESWFTEGRQGFRLSRFIYCLALLPTGLLLIGAAMELSQFLKMIFKRDANLAMVNSYGIAIITFGGYLLFISLYALDYRDFSFMKAIFIYPALLVFPVLFLRSSDALYANLGSRFPKARIAVGVWITALLFLYCAEIISMIQLVSSRRG